MSQRTEYLLDTNVLSETRKKKTNLGVVAFLQSVESSVLYMSVLTLGELRKGVAAKKRIDPAAAKVLGSWVDGLEYSFADHLLGIDAAAARVWGEWSAERPRPVIDTLLAATASLRGMTLVTRNTRDLQGIRVKLLNPWTE